ncbi:DUF2089 domain-containing protein [Sulfobacillus harzensis]|uniref:DUF2089 domain-containing protein n=1 Tax=Sulfobacillus harzensis TaxID=2729629 RepID=A0A7Y0L4V9_9FIRM|nr:DUF2089 domain-containing protein [Sulfobacillus harzensis]NMP23352.1 DUF2089 domain-containing protein [Sulfobacillus harzensis]
MAHFISTCPSCRHTLEVTELECPHCHVQIRGHFQGQPTVGLTDDQREFLRVFVLSRGNLREIERILGISYPTVRSKLDDLVDAFQGGESPAMPSNRRRILEDVADGRLDVKEALARLSEQRKGDPDDAHRD